MHHVVLDLVQQTWYIVVCQIFICILCSFMRVVRYAGIKRLAASDYIYQRLHGLLQRSVRVEPV